MVIKESNGLSTKDEGKLKKEKIGFEDIESQSKIDMFGVGVLNSLSAHIAVLDAEGNIIAVNDAWKKFATENGGDTNSVNVGSNYFKACLCASEKEGIQEAMQASDGIRKVLSGELDEYELEYACHSPDEKRWFSMRATPMHFIGNKAVVSHINITERKIAEVYLIEREKELSALNIISRAANSSISLEDVTKAIIEQISVTINPDLTLLFLKEGEDLLLNGIGPENTFIKFEKSHIHKVGQCLCGLSVSTEESIFSIEIQNDARCTWQECKQAGITSFAAIPLIHRDEVIGTLGIASIKMRDFRKRRQFLEAIANDVAMYLYNSLLYEKVRTYSMDLEVQLSERKQIEKILRQTQKMEAIGKLAGGIAHDFNNILSPVLGYTEMALGDLQKDSPIYANLMEVFKAGIRAKDLVRQILTFARESETERRPIDVSIPVKEAIKLLRSTLPSTIDIAVKIPTDLAPILGDATQIYQIVMNLCTNAAHAMEKRGGRLEMSIEQVYWDSKYIVNYKILPKGYYIKLVISDTGDGIEPDVLESIFDPYYSTKGEGKGTGLGLAVVQSIVKSHDGEIHVYSEPEKGTTFTIYFPTIEAKIISPPEKKQALLTGTESILLVDDEIAIVKMGKQVLEKYGYKVTTASQSTEALRIFKQKPYHFDAVITDMTMPKMRGDQLARKMIEIRPNIPIIMCTGFSRHFSEGILKESGIQAAIMKPFTNEDLCLAVRNAIDDNS